MVYWRLHSQTFSPSAELSFITEKDISLNIPGLKPKSKEDEVINRQLNMQCLETTYSLTVTTYTLSDPKTYGDPKHSGEIALPGYVRNT